MRKSVIVISALISMMLFLSCSKNELNYTVSEIDGVKVFHNKNIPSDPTFKITPKEVFTIHGYDENATDALRNFIFPHDIAVDSQGNIYVLDSRLSSIKKFDKNGKFLTNIGNKGIGPGEMQTASQMLIHEDSIYVSDAETMQHLIFGTDGDFIRNLILEINIRLNSMIPVNSEIFISVMDSWDVREDGYYYTSDLHLRDFKFNVLKSLSRKVGKYEGENTNLHDFSTSFGVGKNQIYIAKNSTEEYTIDVLSATGDLLYKIKKNYRKIEMPEKDADEFAKSKKTADLDDVDRKFKIKYKKAINDMSMFVDKNGYLLVQVPLERKKENEFDFVVDAFKDGVFINRFKMDIGKGFDFYNSDHKRWFIGNRIYYQNREDNCVTVYEY
jgi:hypothetical protein